MFEEDNTKYSWWKIYFILVLQFFFVHFCQRKCFRVNIIFAFIFSIPLPLIVHLSLLPPTPLVSPALSFQMFSVSKIQDVSHLFVIFWFSLLIYSRTAVLFHAVDRQTKKVVDKNVVIEWADPIVDHFILNCFFNSLYCRTVFSKARFLGKLASSSLGWTKISFYFAAK